MIASIIPLLAFLLPLIVEGIKAMQERQTGANHDVNIQNFRKTLSQNDPATRSALLADQHDRMLTAIRGGGFDQADHNHPRGTGPDLSGQRAAAESSGRVP